MLTIFSWEVKKVLIFLRRYGDFKVIKTKGLLVSKQSEKTETIQNMILIQITLYLLHCNKRCGKQINKLHNYILKFAFIPFLTDEILM